MSKPDPRVVVVHDYCTQRGGAERVALSLLRAFPGARLVTAAYEPATTFPEFAQYQVETLWPQRYGVLRKDPRRALPFLARAFAQHEVADADVLVCSTSGWAHGIGGDQAKIVYCHNPARWLYQLDEYLDGRSAALRQGVAWGTRPLRRWDHRSAGTASLYFANSTVVRRRIAHSYGIDAELRPPPSSLLSARDLDPVPGLEPGYFLTVARARGYKNTRVLTEAVRRLPGQRLVVVGGLPQGEQDDAQVTGLTGVSDAQLRWLYANAVGLVAVSREDFGLTPVEAYAFGTPAALLHAGGYLDSAAPGVATTWIESATPEAAAEGMRQLLGTTWDRDAIRGHAESFSEASFQDRVQRAVTSVWQHPRTTRAVTDMRVINEGWRYEPPGSQARDRRQGP